MNKDKQAILLYAMCLQHMLSDLKLRMVGLLHLYYEGKVPDQLRIADNICVDAENAFLSKLPLLPVSIHPDLENAKIGELELMCVDFAKEYQEKVFDDMFKAMGGGKQISPEEAIQQLKLDMKKFEGGMEA
jgi:hypothetical protein